MKLNDFGIESKKELSPDWRQLLFFNTTYEELKDMLKGIDKEIVPFDIESELRVTSQLANGEFVPMTDAIYCPWLDKSKWTHFIVGYNKTTNKCCITTFDSGSKEETDLFIKIANHIPCFYMDGSMGPNEMVFLSPENYEGEILHEYKIIEKDGTEHNYGVMKDGRTFCGDVTYNADYLRFCLSLPKEDRPEWQRRHTVRALENKTYLRNQTKRFHERLKNTPKWIEE